MNVRVEFIYLRVDNIFVNNREHTGLWAHEKNQPVETAEQCGEKQMNVRVLVLTSLARVFVSILTTYLSTIETTPDFRHVKNQHVETTEQ